MKEFTTACPRNCYSTCSFKVQVEDNRIVKILPQPLNNATPEGVCLKGLSYLERAISKDRIVNPVERTKSGELKEISWDLAFSRIASKIKSYHSDYGPQSILFYAASGISGLLNSFSGKFWELLGGATTTYGNLCWPAGLEATRLALGANKHNAPWDIQKARLIIIWGKNPAETNAQQIIHIEKARQSGAKVVVIDPRRTESAEKADILIQPKPGTDAFLALTLANVLIQNEQIDKEFINKYVSGFELFEYHVRQFTPEKAEKITNVPVQAIEELSRHIGTTNPMTLVMGFGMQRFSNGGQTTRAILSLSIITGNIGKAGACWHYANLQSYIFDEMKEPLNYYPKDEKSCFRRIIATSYLGEQILEATNPPIKMAWIERGNPLTQNPDTSIIKKAFDSIDFKVVVDQFLTDTAREADIILPAKNMFEQTDIIGSYWNPYVQLKPKVLDAAGEVKTELEIYNQLAKYLGYKEDELRKYLIAPDDKSIRDWLKSEIDRVGGPRFESLEEGPQLDGTHEEIAFANMKFDTPSGKIELWSDQAKELWGCCELPNYVKPDIETSKNYPFHLLSPNTKNRIHSQFGNLQSIKQFDDQAFVEMNANDARERGIKDGQLLRVYNQNGSLSLKVKLSLSIKKECISISNGWSKEQEGQVNFLTKGRLTDMGYGTAFHDVVVNVKKKEVTDG